VTSVTSSPVRTYRLLYVGNRETRHTRHTPHIGALLPIYFVAVASARQRVRQGWQVRCLVLSRHVAPQRVLARRAGWWQAGKVAGFVDAAPVRCA
jgi:hypothetical protein